MLQIGSLVWATTDVPRAIEFWTAALDYRLREGHDETWAVLLPKTPGAQQMAINLVSSKAETKQRHHIDLYASDRVMEVERLINIGAKKVDWRYPDGADYVILADPDGNNFCVIEKEDMIGTGKNQA